MVSKKKFSLREIRKVLSLPTCQIDGKNANMAHIDKCSARIKGGGIHVTIYPIVNGKIKGPYELRQKFILDSVVRKDVVDFAHKIKKSKKKKPSLKKRSEEYVFSTKI
jgi:hypothetical protein